MVNFNVSGEALPGKIFSLLRASKTKYGALGPSAFVSIIDMCLLCELKLLSLQLTCQYFPWLLEKWILIVHEKHC